MFEFLHKKKQKGQRLANPAFGTVRELAAFPDEAFSSGALGPGVSIEPVSGKVEAPISGKVTALLETNHAIGITSDEGIEVLIHIGVDTVELHGKYFKSQVKINQEVKKGEALLTFDIPKIKEAGYPVTIAFIILNETKDVHYFHLGETLLQQETIMELDN